MAYGDPFPPHWDRVLVASYAEESLLLATGAAQPMPCLTRIAVFGHRNEFPEGRLAPLVGPVREPRINGELAFERMANAGETPFLSWLPPAIAKADSYDIEVLRLDSASGRTVVEQKARLYTTGTSVRLPPQILVAGSEYVFRITAYADPRLTPTSPFRRSQSRASRRS